MRGFAWPLKVAISAVCLAASLAAQAAVELNTGTVADLDELKGIGPALSRRILEARAQGGFKDWADFMRRVKGVNARSAGRLSDAGLTVNGAPFQPVAASPGS